MLALNKQQDYGSTSQPNSSLGNKEGQQANKEKRISKVGAWESIENCLSPKEVPERIPLNLQRFAEHSLKTTAVGESVSAFEAQIQGPGRPLSLGSTGLASRRAKL